MEYQVRKIKQYYECKTLLNMSQILGVHKDQIN